MSLESLSNGWMRYGTGRIWRCIAPAYLCEVDREGNTPSYSKMPGVISKIRQIKSFYTGKLDYGTLNQNGNALDILVANSFAESFGSVPTSFSKPELKNIFDQAAGINTGVRLNEVLNYVKTRQKFLVRQEPGFVNPVATASRVSAGAHHVLISTALQLLNQAGKSSVQTQQFITDLVLRLPSESLFAAELAITYFNKSFSRHKNLPPLLAATYNAGSLHESSANLWNLRQYGNHLDRWISYYNTSRMVTATLASAAIAKTVDPPASNAKKGLELKVVRKTFSQQSTMGEFFVNEQFHAYTLEDVVRAPGVKVYGQTAIPAGRYKVTITDSAHFKRKMPLLINVPNYEGVRIHKGNTAVDTLGCILIGQVKKPDRIENCAGVFDSFYGQLEKVLNGGVECFITGG